MTYTVKVTKQAYGQMREIMLYITNELFAPEAAQNLLDKFQKAISDLADLKGCEMPCYYNSDDEVT